MSLPHRTPIKVRFSELDPYRHVNHAVYVSYFEHARTEALTEIGVPLDELARQGIQVVVMDIAVSYMVPAVAGDLLEVETWITETRRASMKWSQRILRDGEVCVTLELRAAVTDRKGKPTRPPAWLFEKMALLKVEPGAQSE